MIPNANSCLDTCFSDRTAFPTTGLGLCTLGMGVWMREKGKLIWNLRLRRYALRGIGGGDWVPHWWFRGRQPLGNHWDQERKKKQGRWQWDQTGGCQKASFTHLESLCWACIYLIHFKLLITSRETGAVRTGRWRMRGDGHENQTSHRSLRMSHGRK